MKDKKALQGVLFLSFIAFVCRCDQNKKPSHAGGFIAFYFTVRLPLEVLTLTRLSPLPKMNFPSLFV